MNSVEKNLKWMKSEFSKFEKTSVLSADLILFKNALITIKPTSVSSERVFSISGKFVSPLRCRLRDVSIDALVFLKYYFLDREKYDNF